jgi:putative SOS response-associated peptidase YedK
LKPFDANAVRCYPVSTRVNSVVNDDAEFAAPVQIAREQARLF